MHRLLTGVASLVLLFRSVGSRHRLSSCSAQAQWPHGTRIPPRPGMDPGSAAWAGVFLTTGPPGKPSAGFKSNSPQPSAVSGLLLPFQYNEGDVSQCSEEGGWLSTPGEQENQRKVMGTGATSPRGPWLFQLGHQPLAEDGLQPRARLHAGTPGRRASLAVPPPRFRSAHPSISFRHPDGHSPSVTGARGPVVLGPVVFSGFWLYLSASGSK